MGTQISSVKLTHNIYNIPQPVCVNCFMGVTVFLTIKYTLTVYLKCQHNLNICKTKNTAVFVEGKNCKWALQGNAAQTKLSKTRTLDNRI